MKPDSLVKTFIVYINKKFLSSPVKRGSIKAVKTYIQAVKLARQAGLALFGFSAAVALLVVGLALMVGGLVSLIPMEGLARSITAIVLGVVIVAGLGFVFVRVFSQKLWLEISRSHELIDAVAGPSAAQTPTPMPAIQVYPPTEGRDLSRRAESSMPFPFST